MSVDLLSCDTFPGQDVLSAIQTVAPKTTLKLAKTESNGSGVLACDYELSAHENAGDHTLSIVVKMDDSIFTGEPAHDLSVNKDGFDKNRQNAVQNDVKGDATSDTQTVIVPATGLGDEAYFNDYFTRNSDDHSNESVRSYLSILRGNAPYLIDLDLSYSPRSEVGSNPGLPANADPFQNDAVHTMLTAVAHGFLTKIDAAVLHPPVATTAPPTPTSAPGATNVTGGTTPLPEAKVKFRLVNLYAPAAHPEGVAIEGYFQRDASPAPQPGVDKPDIAAVAYGTVSDYANAPDLAFGELALFAAGATDQLTLQNLDGANFGRYTMIVFATSEGQVGSQVFSELPTAVDLAQQHGLPAAPAGQALLVGDGIGLDGRTSVVGFTLGAVGKGCLAPQNQDGFNIPAGPGSVNYIANPGAAQLAYYDSLDSDCSQPPVIGPTAATLTAGERAYVIPYGPKETLRLLIVPIPVLAGDPAPAALPTPTVTASVALPNPCTLLSAAAVAAALGEPVTDTQGSADSGGCTWTGSHSSLGLALQPGTDAATFAALMQGSGVTQTVGGLGDAAYIISDPSNRIFVLHGTTMLALELSRHLDTGQDDPAEDAGILQSLAATVVAGLR